MLGYTRASRFPAWLHKAGMVLYRFLFWWSHKKSNRIIVPTEFVRDDLAKLQPFTRKKSVVTYEASGTPISGKSEPLKGVKRPFIFHLGAPYPHKNIERLIKAFSKLKKTNPDLQLILPGNMKDQFKKDFAQWVGASLEKDSIHAPGFITDAELKWLFENAECYVLPSLSEGFGLPGLEAMMYGCPLVSSNSTCLPEVYGTAAEYFDPRDVDDIAAKAGKVISSKQLQKKLAAKGKKQVAKYSWPKMAQETLEIYRKFL
jgi:glycosyltransferase involved in cell wall biosynthesis